jgi:hypothetical protein
LIEEGGKEEPKVCYSAEKKLSTWSETKKFFKLGHPRSLQHSQE